MTVGLTVLENSRINGVFQGIMDPRVLAGNLPLSARIRDVPAEDSEILARFIGQVHIADIVADDQRAATYSAGKFQFETTNIPNLKVGQNMTQAMLNQWQAIKANGGANIPSSFWDAQARLLANVKLGVALRREQLLAAMLMDNLSYSRLGIQMTNVSWGMPSTLKVTVSPAWTSPTTATPVDNILDMKFTAATLFGITYDHIIMSTPAFRLMVATTEFQNKAKVLPLINFLGSYTPLPLANVQQQQSIAESVLGMSIELYDARYSTQDSRGVYTLLPFWDLNAVVLTSKAMFNGTVNWDFANGVVTETTVADMGGQPIAGGPSAGPVAYATFPQDLNPPNITYWGVQRGFPRKHTLQANACLRIGTVTDTLPPTLPF